MRLAGALVLLVAARPAFADPLPLTAVPTGDDRIAAVKEAQAAPFAGQLFDTPTALRWANYLHQCKYRLSADVEYQKKLDDADQKALQTTLAAERQKYDLVTKDYQDRLSKAEDVPFFRQVWFGVVLGVVGTIGATAATAALVRAAK